MTHTHTHTHTKPHKLATSNPMSNEYLQDDRVNNVGSTYYQAIL